MRLSVDDQLKVGPEPLRTADKFQRAASLSSADCSIRRLFCRARVIASSSVKVMPSAANVGLGKIINAAANAVKNFFISNSLPSSRLAFNQIGEDAAASNEFIKASALDNPARVHDQNPVAISYRR